MRITDLLDRRSVSLTAAPKTKSETLDMAVDLMVKSEKISNREAYRKQVYLRLLQSDWLLGHLLHSLGKDRQQHHPRH